MTTCWERWCCYSRCGWWSFLMTTRFFWNLRLQSIPCPLLNTTDMFVLTKRQTPTAVQQLPCRRELEMTVAEITRDWHNDHISVQASILKLPVFTLCFLSILICFACFSLPLSLSRLLSRMSSQHTLDIFNTHVRVIKYIIEFHY